MGPAWRGLWGQPIFRFRGKCLVKCQGSHPQDELKGRITHQQRLELFLGGNKNQPTNSSLVGHGFTRLEHAPIPSMGLVYLPT